MKSLFLFLATGLFAFTSMGFATSSQTLTSQSNIQESQLAKITPCDEKAVEEFEHWFVDRGYPMDKALENAHQRFIDCMKTPGGITDRTWKVIKKDLTKQYGG